MCCDYDPRGDEAEANAWYAEQLEMVESVGEVIEQFTRIIAVRCETCGQDLRGPYVGDVMTCGGCHGGK